MAVFGKSIQQTQALSFASSRPGKYGVTVSSEQFNTLDVIRRDGTRCVHRDLHTGADFLYPMSALHWSNSLWSKATYEGRLLSALLCRDTWERYHSFDFRFRLLSYNFEGRSTVVGNVCHCMSRPSCSCIIARFGLLYYVSFSIP